MSPTFDQRWTDIECKLRLLYAKHWNSAVWPKCQAPSQVQWQVATESSCNCAELCLGSCDVSLCNERAASVKCYVAANKLVMIVWHVFWLMQACCAHNLLAIAQCRHTSALLECYSRNMLWECYCAAWDSSVGIAPSKYVMWKHTTGDFDTAPTHMQLVKSRIVPANRSCSAMLCN